MGEQEAGSEQKGCTAIQFIHECVAALLSFAIAASATWMLLVTFDSARQVGSDKDNPARADAYNREKDTLLYALALFGAVAGYYFGRVPAELHAQHAQASAVAAQNRLSTSQAMLADAQKNAAKASAEALAATAKLGQTRGDFMVALAKLQTSLSQSAGSGPKGVSAPPEEVLKQALSEVEGLMQKMQA